MRQTSLEKKLKRWGWLFVAPATAFIMVFSFYPMVQALLLSLRAGIGNNLRFTGIRNYVRLFEDEMFLTALKNVLIFMVIRVPIMLFSALVLAAMLNNAKLKFKGTFRTIIFLPCTISLVCSAILFRSFFSVEGIVNVLLKNLYIVSQPVNWLAEPAGARAVIILVIIWRWTGYNTIFYLAGLQNIDVSIYEASRIDGASGMRQFFKITIPLLKPVILLTAIMSVNGTIQLFAEPKNITSAGPGISTLTLSLYIYNLSFVYTPQFGYAATVSYAVLMLVAILSFIQLKAGDRA
jgi:lactose/L-arabinose transport system permease protein